MLTALVVRIEVIRVIDLLLDHRALEHSAIRFNPDTLLALGGILALFEVFQTTTSQAINGTIYRFYLLLLTNVLVNNALDLAGSRFVNDLDQSRRKRRYPASSRTRRTRQRERRRQRKRVRRRPNEIDNFGLSCSVVAS